MVTQGTDTPRRVGSLEDGGASAAWRCRRCGRSSLRGICHDVDDSVACLVETLVAVKDKGETQACACIFSRMVDNGNELPCL